MTCRRRCNPEDGEGGATAPNETKGIKLDLGMRKLPVWAVSLDSKPLFTHFTSTPKARIAEALQDG